MTKTRVSGSISPHNQTKAHTMTHTTKQARKFNLIDSSTLTIEGYDIDELEVEHIDYANHASPRDEARDYNEGSNDCYSVMTMGDIFTL